MLCTLYLSNSLHVSMPSPQDNTNKDNNEGSIPSTRHLCSKIDRCEFAKRQRQITPINEDVSELITYWLCIYTDEFKAKECPYTARFCRVKYQDDRLAQHFEELISRLV